MMLETPAGLRTGLRLGARLNDFFQLRTSARTSGTSSSTKPCFYRIGLCESPEKFGNTGFSLTERIRPREIVDRPPFFADYVNGFVRILCGVASIFFFENSSAVFYQRVPIRWIDISDLGFGEGFYPDSHVNFPLFADMTSSNWRLVDVVCT